MVDRVRGCLLGGALGDALGGPIEFSSLASIRRAYGDSVTLAALGTGRFTDDTQMTLFTAEGIIRASVRRRSKGITSAIDMVHRAYLRWLHTQGAPWSEIARMLPDAAPGPDGWLVTQRVLHRREAPGNTCLSALGSGRVGTLDNRLNNSKGCGGVMRAAPVGLFFSDVDTAFRIGCDIAAITHSHPSGYLSAGALAAMVSRLTVGADMPEAVDVARSLLRAEPESGETVDALDAAVAVASAGPPAAEDLERLGGGWVGEEALATAVACALTAQDFPTSVASRHPHRRQRLDGSDLRQPAGRAMGRRCATARGAGPPRRL